MKKTIFQTIKFLNGDTCEVYLPSFGDISRAMESYGKQKVDEAEKLNITAFLVTEICTFNGVKKYIDFVSKLSGDVFFKIMPIIDQVTNPTI